ncbi:MAG: putative membrane protein [Maribacter sp.]|jgi:putative membrane protein
MSKSGNFRAIRLLLLNRHIKLSPYVHQKNYTAFQKAWWNRFETFLFIIIISVWGALCHFFELTWLKIPWTPLALIGTAVPFVVGFQNNSAYDIIWEARKKWGGIVNIPRTFGMFIQDMISNEYADKAMSAEYIQQEIKTFTYRHIAWITALRRAMRAPKTWESAVNHRTNKEWDNKLSELKSTLEEDITHYISKEDYIFVMSKDNKRHFYTYNLVI